MANVGLPRALMHYTLGTMLTEFLTGLGHRVVVSGPTTKGVLDAGVKMATDQTCLLIKTCFGHLGSLVGKVDIIAFPRWVSIEKSCYICPKFMGLPDMARACVQGLPPLLAPSVEGYSDDKALHKAMLEISDELGTPRREANKVLKEAIRLNAKTPTWLQATPKCSKDIYPIASDMQHLPQKLIAVLGHPYNVYDSFVSMGILQKLDSFGYTPVTYEMIDDRLIEEGLSGVRKPIFWTFGRRLVGASRWLSLNGLVHGIIHIASFGCGPDAFTGQMIALDCEERKVPFLELTLDEHTGEAGFQTRIEAFSDMLERRRPSA